MENPKFVFSRKELRRLRREPTIAIVDYDDTGYALRVFYVSEKKHFLFEVSNTRHPNDPHYRGVAPMPSPDEATFTPAVAYADKRVVDDARDALWRAATGGPAPEVAAEPRRTVRVDLAKRPEMPRGKMSEFILELREWIPCDERLPEIDGVEAADEWLESGNRHIWAAVKGGSHAWIMTAFAVRHAREHNSATGYFGRPDFWMEANAPKPPQ